MGLLLNGTTITNLAVNGVTIDTAYLNGVSVYTASAKFENINVATRDSTSSFSLTNSYTAVGSTSIAFSLIGSWNNLIAQNSSIAGQSGYSNLYGNQIFISTNSGVKTITLNGGNTTNPVLRIIQMSFSKVTTAGAVAAVVSKPSSTPQLSTTAPKGSLVVRITTHAAPSLSGAGTLVADDLAAFSGGHVGYKVYVEDRMDGIAASIPVSFVTTDGDVAVIILPKI